MNSIKLKVKNGIGRMFGYQNCPNCGNSFWWKKESWIIISDIKNLIRFLKLLGVENLTDMRTDLSLCKECLNHPSTLEPSKIEQNLSQLGWSSEEKNRAIQAVKSYKKDPEWKSLNRFDKEDFSIM